MSGQTGRSGEDRLKARVASMAARRVVPSAADAGEPTLVSPPTIFPAIARRQSGAPGEETGQFTSARVLLQPLVDAELLPAIAADRPRGELASIVERIISEGAAAYRLKLDPSNRRDLVTYFLNRKVNGGQSNGQSGAPGLDGAETPKSAQPIALRAKLEEVIPKLYPLVIERIDSEVATRLSRSELATQLAGVVAEVLTELKLPLNQREQRDLVTLLMNDMLGLGPLEPLLADDTVTDIMVNGAKQIYVERRGKLEVTGASFRDNAHVMSIATRIVSTIGRRIDESSPLVDARLPDGSRVNIIIPPLAIDGPSISIRKFSKKTIDLDVMARQQNLSGPMATVLKIASRARLNILISGGTGSGKTTLLNALSQMIDPDERVVTIEDAAELQLQQPHVVRLETRPANLEGRGEVAMRDLVKNALRMRPDRIILGEIRGAEAIDMLQAMNTGHDGSLGTIHANRPREALTRLENMVGMSGINLPSKAVRTQIAAAVHMIVQVSRMRDGVRRIISITEVVGTEGDVITTQELFSYKFEGQGLDGKLRGRFESSGLRPNFMPRAEYYGLDRLLLEAMG
jgi:pilus assembly protein CpaF